MSDGPRLLHYSDIENAYDTPDRIGRLAGTLTARREAGTEALVCGTGDNTAPGVLALVTRGGQALTFFDAVGPDLETFGNHDFDFGPERTRELVADSPQQWVSANVYDGADRFAAADVVPWTTRTVAGETIGVVGVTTPLTASINPKAGGLRFEDPVAAAREAVADLRATTDPDHVVVLSHLGTGDEELATAVDVDVVLGGHLHSETIERVDGTILTRPGVNGEVVFEVDLGDGSVTRHAVADGPLDRDLAEALRDRMDRAGLDEHVAMVAEPIERTETACFRGESRIGNFVADAYLWAGDGDVALQNSGGVRSGPPLAGEVTVRDLISVIPFEEPAVVVEVSGATLRETFAGAGGAEIGFGAPDWWHAHVAGAELAYDYRSHDLVRATVGGDPIDDDRTYRLVTADYLLHTADEFPALTGLDPVETLDTQYRILVDYAREHGINPTLEGRIERHGV